jgi:hypothetical protein
MALQAFPVKRVQDGGTVRNLMEITPINWRRYPSKTITKAMTDRQFLGPVTYTGGVANQGAASNNNGEVGTINSTDPSRGQAWNTQNEKATALLTTIAVDVGKSYHGTRGKIESFEPYPVTVPRATTPAAFQTTQQQAWDLS